MSAASGEKIAATIAWSGRSIDKASYWIDGRPFGTGWQGYEKVFNLVRKLPEGSSIVINPYQADYVELIEMYSRVDDLPFADDTETKSKFDSLLSSRKIHCKVVPLQSFGKLPAQ